MRYLSVINTLLIQGDPKKKKNGLRVFRIIRIGARFFLGHPVRFERVMHTLDIGSAY